MDLSLSIEGRCDQISHCRDKSDEEDCQLMVLDRGYKRNVAPFTLVISSLISYIGVLSDDESGSTANLTLSSLLLDFLVAKAPQEIAGHSQSVTKSVSH